MLSRKLLVWFFYFLAAIFFIAVASSATLYAAGYSINPKDWTIEKTGILVLHTQPSGADIELDGNKLGYKTPASIRHLLPRTYQLTVSYPGYHRFEKEIEIESGLLTEENYVVLFFDHPSKTDWKLEGVKNAFPYPSQDALLVQKLDGTLTRLGLASKELVVLSNPSSSIELSLENRNFIAQAKITRATFSPNGNAVFLLLERGSKIKEVLIEDKKITVLPNELVSTDTQTVFLAANGNRYLRLTKENLYLVDGDNMVLKTGRVKAVATSGNEVLYIQQSQLGQSILKSGLSENPQLITQKLPQAQNYKLEKIAGIIFLTTINQGVQELWIYLEKEDEFQKLVSGYVGELFSDGKSIFYQTPYEIISYDPDPKKGEDKIKTITRLTQPLYLVNKNGRELFFTQGNDLRVIKTDGFNNWLLLPDFGNKIFIDKQSVRAYGLEKNILSEVTLRNELTSVINNLIQNWRVRLT